MTKELVKNLSSYDMQLIDAQLDALMNAQHVQSLADTAARIDYFSKIFLDKPYLLYPTGEGIAGKFDQSPIYRFDCFDCITLVNTVMALSFASSAQEFREYMIRLVYRDNTPTFLTRKYFMTVDWNPHNVEQGFIADITENFVDVNNQPLVQVARNNYERRRWFLKRDVDDIKLLDAVTAQQQQQLLRQLHSLAEYVHDEIGELAYLPLSKLFDADKQPQMDYFLQMPNAAIVEIVRPNWDLRDKIGTNVNVSHIGFVFWKNDQLIFRHASQLHGKVEDVLLTDYLRFNLADPTVGGINVHKIIL